MRCQVRKMTDVLTEENAIRREMHKNGRKAVLETGKVYWAVKPNEREKGDMVKVVSPQRHDGGQDDRQGIRYAYNCTDRN